VTDAPSDRELIRRALEEDPEAFGGIVRRYQQRLYWAAWRITGRHEDARDVAQEAFVRAWEKLVRFDRGRRFYTWIYRIMANLAIDRLRERRRTVPLVAAQEREGGEPTPEERAAGEELRLEVQRALSRLPAKYRQLLVLRDVEGLTAKEISIASGVSHGTVRWRLFRARRLFREAWEEVTSRREDDR
jgi:RNA polymerase sigma-70 factor (ECF subfamily)